MSAIVNTVNMESDTSNDNSYICDCLYTATPFEIPEGIKKYKPGNRLCLGSFGNLIKYWK